MGFLDFFRTAPKPSPRRRRGFDAAAINRYVNDWLTSSTSLDAEIRKGLRKCRERSRDLARNNDHARNAVRVICNNVVGTGIQMQATVKMRRGGKLDKVTNDAIEAAWSKWKRADTCHTAGMLSFSELERALVRAVVVDGEVFVRKVKQPFGAGKIPFALEVIDADRLDTDYNDMRGGNEIRMGVERDRWGRPVAYHFDAKNPGDTTFPVATIDPKKNRIPASEVVHLFVADAPNQTRGIPWFVSAILRMHHLAGFTEAEVIAARAEACRMGFITSPEDMAGEDDTEADGTPISSFEPGRIERLLPGESYTEAKPSRPGGTFEPFVKTMLRSMAAGIGITYASLSRDYSEVNYSSGRLELLDERDNWRVLQNWLIDRLHASIFPEWLEGAVLSGELKLTGYETSPAAYEAVRWVPRGWSWVDPQKEITALKDAVRCGFITQADVIAQSGGDFEAVVEGRKYELELADQAGLTFDTDPGAVAKNGSAQPAASAAPDPEDDPAIDNVEDQATVDAQA